MNHDTEREALRYDQPPEALASDHPWLRIRDLVTSGTSVLDVGCGSGSLGRLLTTKGVAVDGVEMNPDRAAVAAEYLRTVAVGPAGSETRSQLATNYDFVLFTDVLEHVTDPTELLSWGRSMLAPGGRVIAQIPNSANWRFRMKILRGDWRYAESGFFDRDHVRFFDVRTAQDLGNDLGLVPESVSYPPMDLPWKFRYKKHWARTLADRWPNLMAAHVLVVWQDPVVRSACR